MPKKTWGMIGKAGMRSRRANGLKSAIEGYCSSPPMTATGKIGGTEGEFRRVDGRWYFSIQNRMGGPGR